ncbi:MAG: trypsin-like peptidase domain-containing protein [Phycisphaerales bacterium]
MISVHDRSFGRRCTALAATCVAALIGSAASGQANCPAAGSCFVAHATGGCDNQACCQAVCAIDPFCCNSQWDSICVNEANQLCAGTPPCQPACNKLNIECLNPGAEYNNRTFVGQLRLPPGNQQPANPTNPQGYCTAWIIAAPNILFTNNHCAPQVGDIVAFNFECTACNGGVVKATTNFAVTQILACNVAQDWCLFRVAGNPAATFGQAKIDPSVPALNQPVYEIHHAEAKVKGFDDGTITGLFLPHPSGCPGTIQEHSVSLIASQGASGSPVFRKDNHCVTAACNCGPPCSAGFVLPMSILWPNLKATITANGGTFIECAQSICPSSDHNCFTTGGAGCTNVACCNAVCAVDPFCCTTSWDATCVNEASAMCDGCGDPAAGDCCAAHTTPFCNKRTCCELICANDSFCCTNQWDQTCVGEAQALTVCGCAPPSCPGARLDFGVTPDDFGNPNACVAAGPIAITKQYVFTNGILFGTAVDKPGTPAVGILTDGACSPACRSAGLPPFTTDWWCQFNIGSAAGTPGMPAGVNTFSAELCFIDGVVKMEGYDNDCVLIASTASTMLGTQKLTITAPTGKLIAYVRVVASDPARPAGVTVDCLAYDGPFPRFVCPDSAHNCFTTGGPGCSDDACCATVCNVDSFCCTVAWDATCVNEAGSLCGNCGGPNAGSCYCAHPGIGCSDKACCVEVCAADPFCCQVSWDGTCANEASLFCCPEDFNGDGVVNGADLGLQLAAWGTNQCPFDLNHDGVVNGADLGLELAAWGPCN